MDNEADGTDDFTAFEAQATGTAEPEKVEAPEAPTDQQEPDDDEPNPEVNDEAGEPEGDDEPEKGKRNKPAHERIGELTKARREAERRAEAAEERLRQLESGKQPETQAQPTDLVEPNPDEFEFGEADPAYLKALAKYEVRSELKAEREQQETIQRQRTFEQQATQLDTSWSEQAEKASERYDDFSEVIADYQVKQPCPPILAIAIQESEFGADVAYHLAKNPKENRELAELSVTNPLEAAKRFGRLEARFDSADKGKPQPKRVTDAPTPPEQRARGSGGHYQASGDTTDFAAFERVANKQ